MQHYMPSRKAAHITAQTSQPTAGCGPCRPAFRTCLLVFSIKSDRPPVDKKVRPMQAFVENPAGARPSRASPELLRLANADLIARSVRGVISYSVMLIVLAATTEYRTHHALLFWSFAASVVITIGTRLGLKACGERVHALPPGRLDLLLAVAVGVPSVATGVIHASALWFYGFESWPFVITMLWTVGCASGSTISFTPDLFLLRLYLWTAWAPVFCVDLLLGGE